MSDAPSSNQPTTALHVTGLCFAYPGQTPVLQGIDLRILNGERVGFIGPNGAGKTTLFMLLCGLLRPGNGQIVIYQQPLRPGRFNPDIGMVFQNPDDQLFSPSVWDDVAFGPQNMGLSPGETTRRVQDALHVTGTDGLAQRPPHHLSGGEKRMVSIAGVLAMQPRLIIYDEPSANLDIRARRRFIDFLRQSSQTALISSHDLDLLLELCERVVLLDEGRVIADGETRRIMGDDALLEAHGLERPCSFLNLQ